MKRRSNRVQQDTQIKVAADGCRNIPTDVGIKLVRDLFEGIGVDRLRADRYFAHLSFCDVSELGDDELTEAIAIGLDYLTADSASDRSIVKTALMELLAAQFGNPRGKVIFRVGRSYTKAWPNDRTLTH
ncbi:hypothetical protein [Duganella vulcania]|uniref:Uncharacterized protein n=1 Tax=Duganella vulcania TaxID=2692166 RepID=A0A845GX47_9BURK|nr:hypothetical protein [Duganella vulcania]MYM97902.1 hypothetical protein [Duganella vulcania]